MKTKLLKETIISIILILGIIFISGCSNDEIKYVPKVPDEIENFKKITGTHTILDDDVSSYILIKSKPNKNDLLYSMTIYMDFEKGNRTNRLYNYYQIDYLLKDDTFGADYHIFDSIDGVKRSYAQNFMPFYNLGNILSNIKYLIKYSYDKKDDNNKVITYNKNLSYSEDIIEFNNKVDYLNECNEYDISFIKEKITGEKYSRYKINIKPLLQNIKGHMDVQCYIKYKDGNLYPFYGIYHYNLNKGEYLSVSDEKIDDEYEIDKVYFIINTYIINQNDYNSVYYEAKIEIK